MKKEQNQLSRKRFLLWGSGLASVWAASRLFPFSGATPKPKPKMVKMLSQEGQLVEVDVSRIVSSHKQINDAEIHTWVNHHKPLNEVHHE